MRICPLASPRHAQQRHDATSTFQVPPCPPLPPLPAYSQKGCEYYKEKGMGAKQIPKAHNYMSCLASLLDPEQCEGEACLVRLQISGCPVDAQ